MKEKPNVKKSGKGRSGPGTFTVEFSQQTLPPPHFPSSLRDKLESAALIAAAILLPFLMMGAGILGAVYFGHVQYALDPEPQPPPARYAHFEAAVASTTTDPVLSFVIADGSYNVEMLGHAKSSIQAIQSELRDHKVFIANFKTGETVGDHTSADVYVFVGDVRVTIGSMSNSDTLLASIATAGPRMKAHFLYANSSQGPPKGFDAAAEGKKTLYILGNVTNYVFPAAKGESTRDLRILELEPDSTELFIYKNKLEKWRSAKELNERPPHRGTDPSRRATRAHRA
jgi:hypothetical protein